MPWAVATSSLLEAARPTLDLLEIPADVPVVTRDQVARAKPDPDLFLAAAQRLGADITNAIVVGDSVWDLLAARRARALGVGLLAGGYGREELPPGYCLPTSPPIFGSPVRRSRVASRYLALGRSPLTGCRGRSDQERSRRAAEWARVPGD